MLKRLDRVQIATHDRARGEHTASLLLGAELLRRDEVEPLGAARTLMQVGSGLIELLEPKSAGPISRHLERFGEGLFGAGFAVEEMDAVEARFKQSGLPYQKAQGQLFPDPAATMGMRCVLSTRHERAPAGPLRSLYEATFLVADWRASAARYGAIFSLDAGRFLPITIEEFGYTGTLAMFDPPARLDRIELAQVTDPASPMGRFYARRGSSWYMFYVEADDLPSVAARLRAHRARFSEHSGFSTIYLHPSAFCATLIGISRTGAAWRWSRPS